jgi:hypothetical protein
MWDAEFVEPTRDEVVRMKSIWRGAVLNCLATTTATSTSTAASSNANASASKEDDTAFLLSLHERCPYLVEPPLAIACLMSGVADVVKVGIYVHACLYKDLYTMMLISTYMLYVTYVPMQSSISLDLTGRSCLSRCLRLGARWR